MKAKSLETALEKVSRVITDRYGLRLVCKGNSCKTNGKIIYLPSLPEDVPQELLGAIRGFADHECAHAIFTQTKLGPKFQEKHGERAFAILNALEDARVEKRMSRRYAGAKLNLEEGFRFVSEKMKRKQCPNPFKDFVSALYTLASGRPNQPWVTESAYNLADECQGELSELPSCRNTRQVAELALRVWQKIRELFDGEEQASESEQSESVKREQQTSASGDSKESEDSHTEPKTPAAKSPVAAGGSSGERQDTSSPMGELGSLIEDTLRQQHSGEEGTYRVYTTQYDVVEVPKPDGNFDYRREIQAAHQYIGGLRRRLIQTLMGRRESRWLDDQARGRLDPRALHRIVTGRSGRVFRKRIDTDGGKTACTLLLDLSSSMGGAQIQLCRQLALIFAETLDKLSFPTEIIGFSTVDRDLRAEIAQETGAEIEELAKRFSRMVPLYHAIYKQFNEPWRNAAGRFGGIRTQSLTPLGESLLFAGKRLAHRPEKRKVLFCLTDGKPVVGAWDERVTLQHACQAVKKLSEAGIEPVGIGILEECVREIFPRHAIIHDLAELPKSFLKQLCRVLTAR